jgi:hypothetical protein
MLQLMFAVVVFPAITATRLELQAGRLLTVYQPLSNWNR